MKFRWHRYSDHPRAFLVQLFVSIIIVMVGLAVLLSVARPKVQVAAVTSQNNKATLLGDIKVSFSLPVSRENFSPSITPTLDGQWSWADPVLGTRLYRTAVFEPSVPYAPETNYVVEINGIQSITKASSASSYSFDFTTQPLPTVRSVSAGDAQKITDPITVELDYPADRAVEHFFSLSPEVELEISQSLDKLSYKLLPKAPLQQGVTYSLRIERELIQYDKDLEQVLRRSTRELVMEKSFKTTEPLGLASITPQGIDILPDTRALTISFVEAVQQEKALEFISLTPLPPGQWRWSSDRVLEYVFSKPLEFDTTYSLNLAAGLPASNGSSLSSAGQFSFTSVGDLIVRAVSPAKGASGVARSSQLSLRFNQPADRASVEGALAISPGISFSKSWKDDKTLVIVPSTALEHSKTYTISLAESAKSSYGRKLAGAFTSSFSTEEQVVVLAVGLDKQDRALSCEVAALKMALTYRGVRVSEDDLMGIVGYDPTVRSGNVWGDPDVAFVGDINGSQNSSGYGVHWAPIARAANSFRANKGQSDLSLQDLTREIDAGNPIVVWGTHGRAYYDPWTTPSGKTVPAWKGEHARVVIGYKGSPSQPSAIITNDPIAGKMTWKAADFDANWARLSRAGVIIL